MDERSESAIAHPDALRNNVIPEEEYLPALSSASGSHCRVLSGGSQGRRHPLSSPGAAGGRWTEDWERRSGTRAGVEATGLGSGAGGEKYQVNKLGQVTLVYTARCSVCEAISCPL